MQVETIQENISLQQACYYHFAAVDVTPLEPEDLTPSKLTQLVQNCAKSFIKNMSKLPYENTEDGRLITLPLCQSIVLPRHRPLPAAQHKTRWQRFAQERNIHKTKRSKLVWDSLVNDWVPRWGKDSLNRRKQKLEESIIELKPNEDLRTVVASRRAEQTIRKTKQSLNEHRNKIESLGGSLKNFKTKSINPSLLTKGSSMNKNLLEEMNRRAAISNASFGKYSALPQSHKRSKKISQNSQKINKKKKVTFSI